ncbi:Beta-lactamase [Moraxella cuniculi DSM 21768]|uniref:Beta-lactamase n=1 Tax=Moraxella cuniculi DSM 21768 TaxID=1122245 RepID=A0A1N7FPR4_9GAMM|nr:serine hydrolase domain-containing protein [Moraxella cuniculi]OOS07179.1 EstA family serine hydrolase [Moraxella cuniculi]SIS02287.1 Beta-lactamase [Moraxella cuniculi DSM 21768]
MQYADFQATLDALQFDDVPAGGALVIYHQGEQVVCASTGQALPNQPWSDQTLSVNFSIGKGVMATLIAILVSQGLLEYERPVSYYWQDFAKNGKADILLSEVLSHRAGLFDISSVASDAAILLDWTQMLDRVAAMPVCIPKSQDKENYASAYSALVSGWVLGGVVERATGMSLNEALQRYLAEPLGVSGQLYYGIDASLLNQIAKPVRYFYESPNDTTVRRKPVLKPDSEAVLEKLTQLSAAKHWQEALMGQKLTTANINRLYFDTSRMNLSNYKNALMPNAKDGLEYHRDDVLMACIPAANGVSTAQALARIYAMHAADGVWQDKQFIRPEVMARLRLVQTDGFDAVMPANMRWRMGFHRLFALQQTDGYGHMGYNGSVAFCDPKRRLAFAFIHNFDTTMLNDIRQFALSEMALAMFAP